MGLFEYLKTWLIVKWAVKEQIPQIIQDTCTKFNLNKIVAKNETSHDFYINVPRKIPCFSMVI